MKLGAQLLLLRVLLCLALFGQSVGASSLADNVFGTGYSCAKCLETECDGKHSAACVNCANSCSNKVATIVYFENLPNRSPTIVFGNVVHKMSEWISKLPTPPPRFPSEKQFKQKSIQSKEI